MVNEVRLLGYLRQAPTLSCTPNGTPYTLLAIETGWLATQVAASWRLVATGHGIVSLVTLAAALQLAQVASALGASLSSRI